MGFMACFRVSFRGYLPIMSGWQMAQFFNSSGIRFRELKTFLVRGQCGAVAFVQRFGSSLNLHPHVHVLVLDGVFAGLEKETPRFYPLRAPDDSDVAAVAETTSRRTQALLSRKGIGASSDEDDEDSL